MTNPILNGPSFFSSQSHYHPVQVRKIGSFDVVVSLEAVKQAIARNRMMLGWTAVYLFGILAATISVIIAFLGDPPH